MKLFSICTSCKNSLNIKSNAVSRHDLIRDKGEFFVIQCNHCLKNQKIHVNQVRARENKIIIIGGILIGLLITIVLWNFLGAIGTISIAVPILVWRQQQESVHTFNKYII